MCPDDWHAAGSNSEHIAALVADALARDPAAHTPCNRHGTERAVVQKRLDGEEREAL